MKFALGAVGAVEPGFVPRSKFDSELYPRLQRFADEVIAKL